MLISLSDVSTTLSNSLTGEVFVGSEFMEGERGGVGRTSRDSRGHEVAQALPHCTHGQFEIVAPRRVSYFTLRKRQDLFATEVRFGVLKRQLAFRYCAVFLSFPILTAGVSNFLTVRGATLSLRISHCCSVEVSSVLLPGCVSSKKWWL